MATGRDWVMNRDYLDFRPGPPARQMTTRGDFAETGNRAA
jgi:hypothetical protein